MVKRLWSPAWLHGGGGWSAIVATWRWGSRREKMRVMVVAAFKVACRSGGPPLAVYHGGGWMSWLVDNFLVFD